MTIEINENTHTCQDYYIESHGCTVCRICGLVAKGIKIYDGESFIKPTNDRYGTEYNTETNLAEASSVFNIPGSRFNANERRKMISGEDYAMLKTIRIIRKVSSYLNVGWKEASRASYVARKILRNKQNMFKCNVISAVAAGFYIAFRESGALFFPLTIINAMADLGHFVTLSRILKVVSYYAKFVNYNRDRSNGGAIYMKRIIKSVAFRASYYSKQYEIPFDSFLKNVKEQYVDLRAEQVRKHGAITSGHALLVCRAIRRAEIAMDVVMKANGFKVKQIFTIPFLLSIVTPKAGLVIG